MDLCILEEHVYIDALNVCIVGPNITEEQHWLCFLVREYVVGDIQLHGSRGWWSRNHDQWQQSSTLGIHLFGRFYGHSLSSGTNCF